MRHTVRDWVRAILGHWSDGPAHLATYVAGDLDACGPFADWLQEQGRDYEAKLLRRRWAMWKRERYEAEEERKQLEAVLNEPLRQLAELVKKMPNAHMQYGSVVTHNGKRDADVRLQKYIRERFGNESGV